MRWKARGITKLPAVPQIGSLLMLEFSEEEVCTYEIMVVQMTAATMEPKTFASLSDSEMPFFVNYVKVFLRDVGPAMTEEEAWARSTSQDDRGSDPSAQGEAGG